jgi:hypothetical protein
MTETPEQQKPVLGLEVEFTAVAHGTWFMPDQTGTDAQEPEEPKPKPE